MPELYITQIKPNPSGKDRVGNQVSSQQLAGEWVDFKNTSQKNLSLDSVRLEHIAYTTSYPNGVWEVVSNLHGNLASGQIMRVHSGAEIPLTSLYSVDRIGADHHLFTGKNYIWNNSKSDSPKLSVWNGSSWVEIDKATYSPPVAEGAILLRYGNLLK